MKNKIGWCNTTWNPVWGCLNHCEYCYARKIANFRYAQMGQIEYHHYVKNPLCFVWTDTYLAGLKDFRPTFLLSQFNKKLPKKPQRIFVGSMSEIYYWEEEWMERVLNKVKQYPQHTFMFLTKFPEVYLKYKFPENCWLGVTITNQESFSYENYLDFRMCFGGNITFISYEPLLSDYVMGLIITGVDWVIIGAETGNRKDKVVPKREWIGKIVKYCRNNNIPIYLKDSILLGNLKNIYLDEIKEFPKKEDK